MTPLSDIFRDDIKSSGSVTVGEFMRKALGHPEHGYYMSRDPLGRGGDFITAPEVSQMFGEVLGAYFVHQWMRLGQPKVFIFLECGPGRGTLMADMLRAGSAFPGFVEAARVHLLESSPALKEKQAQALKTYGPVWHEDLSTVPDDAPLMIVGNEFLDALAIHQLEMTNAGWYERVVSHEEGGRGFYFDRVEISETLQDYLPDTSNKMLHESLLSDSQGHDFQISGGAEDVPVGTILEVSPEREEFVREVCALLAKGNGSALFVDYGHVKSSYGDTLQAVKDHEYCDVLEHIGEADITAHVDFEAVKNVAERARAQVSGPVEQGEFLRVMGLFERAQMLKSAATPEQGEEIEKALHRLTHADEMGTLFKVIGFGYGAV